MGYSYGGYGYGGGGGGGNAMQGGGIGGLISKVIQGNATQNAWNTVSGGYQQGAQTIGSYNTAAQGQLQPYQTLAQQVGPQIVANTAPFTTASQGAVTGMQNTLQQPLNVSQFYNPGMAFAMQQGQQAIERSAAARGGVINGSALKNISSYITGVASQNYNNAANLALQQRQQQLTGYGTLMQGGLNANAQLSPLYQGGIGAAQTGAQLNAQAGGNIAAAQSNAANAQAQGQAAQGSSMGSIIGSVASIASAFL